MKTCETCDIKAKKLDPGYCLIFKEEYNDGPYNCWKPIENCLTCGGNGKVYMGVREGFKPCPDCQTNKEICSTCGGTKEICICHGKQKDKCYDGRIEGKYYMPCPDCQKPKKERLMMPVYWKKKSCEETYYLFTKMNNKKQIGQVYFHNGRYRANADGESLRNGTKMGWNDLEQAKAAVEKALGITKQKEG